MKSVATLQLGYKVGIKKPSYYPISTNIEEKLGKNPQHNPIYDVNQKIKDL